MDTQRQPLSDAHKRVRIADEPQAAGGDAAQKIEDPVGWMRHLLDKKQSESTAADLVVLKAAMRKQWLATRLPMYEVVVSGPAGQSKAERYLFKSYQRCTLFLDGVRNRLWAEFNTLCVTVFLHEASESASVAYDAASCECLVNFDDSAFALRHMRERFSLSTKSRDDYLGALCSARTLDNTEPPLAEIMAALGKARPLRASAQGENRWI
jgi:hypothetical protein